MAAGSRKVLRAGDRFVTQEHGRVSRHCFSFGRHYDPTNTGFGALVGCNDEQLAVGGGYPDHPHAGIDLVTWVVAGALRHNDSAGRSAVSGPDTAQVLSAGSGITHSERNAGAEPCRFVQFWLSSATDGRQGYRQVDVGVARQGGELVPIVTLDVSGARLLAGLFAAGAEFVLPPADLLHLFVVRGTVTVDGMGALAAGDSARLAGAGAVQAATTAAGTEILVWLMDA